MPVDGLTPIPSVDSPVVDIERLEIELLFKALHSRYGYDFRNYAPDSARRRVLYRLQLEGLESIGALQHRVLHDEALADSLLRDLSINVTGMFRDPGFYRTLREEAAPWLARQEHIKIWHAGCASGEEVYSMAILLTEEGLYDRSQLYATDFNNAVLEKAKSGIFPLHQMRSYVQNYQSARGREDFSDYYHAHYDGVIMDAALKKNILFSHHNLTTDSSFGEMQMVVCRNVLIYFAPSLQERVFHLLYDSLCEDGLLCLGSRETLLLSSLKHHFETLSSEQRIYKKKD